MNASSSQENIRSTNTNFVFIYRSIRYTSKYIFLEAVLGRDCATPNIYTEFWGLIAACFVCQNRMLSINSFCFLHTECYILIVFVFCTHGNFLMFACKKATLHPYYICQYHSPTRVLLLYDWLIQVDVFLPLYSYSSMLVYSYGIWATEVLLFTIRDHDHCSAAKNTTIPGI